MKPARKKSLARGVDGPLYGSGNYLKFGSVMSPAKATDNAITFEDHQFYFAVNGCKVKAEDVKFMTPEDVQRGCDRLLWAKAFHGASLLPLDKSISPPRAVERPWLQLNNRRYRHKETGGFHCGPGTIVNLTRRVSNARCLP